MAINPDSGSPACNGITALIDYYGGAVIAAARRRPDGRLAGTYSGGMTMTAAPAVPKQGYRLLGAVAPGPDANWYFKFTGPDATVNAQRDAFTSMVKSLKHGAS
jgi:hypothetical protein